jgi:hypothetical protein
MPTITPASLGAILVFTFNTVMALWLDYCCTFDFSYFHRIIISGRYVEGTHSGVSGYPQLGDYAFVLPVYSLLKV